MATPKKRLSRSKRGMRRAHDFLTAGTVHTCSNCNALVQPHHVCPSCGFYKGKAIVSAPAEAQTQQQ